MPEEDDKVRRAREALCNLMICLSLEIGIMIQIRVLQARSLTGIRGSHSKSLSNIQTLKNSP